VIKQLILPFVGVAAFITIVGFLYQGKINFKSPLVASPNTVSKETLKIGGREIRVEIADTPDKREKGLGGVTSLGENEGMLFVSDQKDTSPIFWMKGMLIPLDIIWINDGKVVKIDKNIPNPDPNTPESELKRYSPTSVVDYVLEVNAGFSDKFGLKVGDTAEGNSIKN
jgi:hypothetical protein